ncbi:hypothetical protein C2846_05475 [Pseudomonas jilinensis]|uniref:Uncharacterized protein n=2 Tax=Pseudomonas jilinensis TaxID=2078689 RepID=A0A396S2L6_9PSED|nr:hypothetical protein C2846_05475 [Pseudomonas jilinensis]
MAIYRKDVVRKYQEELERYYAQLSAELAGRPPSENLAHSYNREPDAFLAEFTDIDLEKLELQIAHFKVTADFLKKLSKGKQAKPNAQ